MQRRRAGWLSWRLLCGPADRIGGRKKARNFRCFHCQAHFDAIKAFTVRVLWFIGYSIVEASRFETGKRNTDRCHVTWRERQIPAHGNFEFWM